MCAVGSPIFSADRIWSLYLPHQFRLTVPVSDCTVHRSDLLPQSQNCGSHICRLAAARFLHNVPWQYSPHRWQDFFAAGTPILHSAAGDTIRCAAVQILVHKIVHDICLEFFFEIHNIIWNITICAYFLVSSTAERPQHFRFFLDCPARPAKSAWLLRSHRNLFF